MMLLGLPCWKDRHHAQTFATTHDFFLHAPDGEYEGPDLNWIALKHDCLDFILMLHSKLEGTVWEGYVAPAHDTLTPRVPSLIAKLLDFYASVDSDATCY